MDRACSFCQSKSASYLCPCDNEIYYCGDECAALHWPEHQLICGKRERDIREKANPDQIFCGKKWSPLTMDVSRTDEQSPPALQPIAGVFDYYLKYGKENRDIFLKIIDQLHAVRLAALIEEIAHPPLLYEKQNPDVFIPTDEHRLRMIRWISEFIRTNIGALNRGWDAFGESIREKYHRAFDMLFKLLRNEQVTQRGRSFFLVLAAEHNNLHALVSMLDDENEDFDPTYKDSQALRLACDIGHTDIVKALLNDLRSDPTVLQNACMSSAISGKRVSIVKLLLQDRRTPIDDMFISHLSINIDLEIFSVILSDRRISKRTRYHALGWCVRHGKDDLVDIILADRRSTPEFLRLALDEVGRVFFLRSLKKDLLFKVIRHENMEWHEHPELAYQIISRSIAANFQDVIAFFLTYDPPIPNVHNRALIEAAHKGDVTFVRNLLKDPLVDPSYDNWKALNSAIERNQVEALRLLLESAHGPVTIDSKSVNEYLRWRKDEEKDVRVMKMLLKLDNFDPTVNNNVYVEEAIWSGYTSMVKLLLDDPRVASSVNWDKLLEIAVERELQHMIKLIQSYMNIHVRSEKRTKLVERRVQ